MDRIVRSTTKSPCNLSPAFDRFADELDAVARFGEGLEVGNGFIPVQELVVHSNLMAEVRFRIGNGC